MAQRDRGCAPHAYSVLMNVSLGKPDFVAPLAPRNLAIFDDALDHYGALDSLYENDMLESVPVAPGEQSNYQQAIAARRAYDYEQAMAARRRYKRKQLLDTLEYTLERLRTKDSPDLGPFPKLPEGNTQAGALYIYILYRYYIYYSYSSL